MEESPGARHPPHRSGRPGARAQPSLSAPVAAPWWQKRGRVSAPGIRVTSGLWGSRRLGQVALSCAGTWDQERRAVAAGRSWLCPQEAGSGPRPPAKARTSFPRL